MSENLKYGESEILAFDPQKDLEIWENSSKNNYLIKITLPEFCCLCPRSGYPDFATIYLEYIPNKFVVELKALKFYINSFMNRHISHEASVNEIYDLLKEKLDPKFIKIVGDFNPRGNVHTLIEVNSEMQKKSSEKIEKKEIFTEKKAKFEKKERNFDKKQPRKKSQNEPFFSSKKLQSKKPEIRKNK